MNVTRQFSNLLCTTMLTLVIHSSASAAFNPQSDSSGTVLPSTHTLYEHDAGSGTSGLPHNTAPLPLYPTRKIVMPVAPVLPPAKTLQAAAAPVIVPANTLPPASFPPVDASVVASAKAQLAKETPPMVNITPGFIAPAPLMAQAPAEMPPAPPAPPTIEAAAPVVTPLAVVVAAEPLPAVVQPAPAVVVAAAEPVAPVIQPAPPVVVAAAEPVAPIIKPAPHITAATIQPAVKPVVIQPAPPIIVAAAAPTELAPVITPPAQPLSTQSKNILAHVPSKMDTVTPKKSAKLKLNRVSPEVDAVLGADSTEQKYESVGLSIKVRRPGLDANYELNRAYTSLMGGDTEAAVETYKNILSTQPNNQDALFGLAATYHRLGDLDHARPLYGALLKQNPNHREGLNNFLALISDESPQEALAELERLEQRNPDFSPIPAQQAIVLDKLGYVEESRSKMLRAIELAPENLSYKYNLAVMSDRNGNFADASALYRLLIDAGLKGETLPAALPDLQKRLNFITSTAAANGKAVGG